MSLSVSESAAEMRSWRMAMQRIRYSLSYKLMESSSIDRYEPTHMSMLGVVVMRLIVAYRRDRPE